MATHFIKTIAHAGGQLLVYLVLMSTLSCQKYFFVFKKIQRVAVTEVRESVLQGSNTDVLFIIDNSGSMYEEQQNLANNVVYFVDTLAASDNEYQVGIISTDALDQTNTGLDKGQLRMVHANQTALNTANCNIAPDTSTQPFWQRPKDDDPNVQKLICRLIEDIRATVNSLGIQGGGREAGLLAARMAIDPKSVAASHNKDFVRTNADLALIFLTDEDDCSYENYDWGTNNNEDCYVRKAQAIPPKDLVTSLAGFKSSTIGVQKLRAALIAGGAFESENNTNFVARGCRIDETNKPSAACGCWSASDDSFFCELLNGYGQPCTDTVGCMGTETDPGDFCKKNSTGSCDTPRCEALPASRYTDFLQELKTARADVGFFGGVFEDSICQPDYHNTLVDIANKIVLSDCFSLEVPAMDVNNIRLILRHSNPDTGETTDAILPRYDESDPTAECRSCANDCPAGAWHYVDSKTICLACELKKETGDFFILTVLNETVGVEEDGGQE